MVLFKHMVKKKTKEEIAIMRQGGKILAETLWEVMRAIKPGISEIELDKLAEKIILQKGGQPGFKRVKGYRHTICVSTNDVVVHGIPTNYRFKEGDVVGIDCGVFYKGFNTDMAETIQVQSSKFKVQSKETRKFLETGKRALEEAIKAAIIDNRIGHISKTIQDIVERQGGYSIVRTLVGHGVGKSLHEQPEVPGFLDVPISETPLLEEGLTIAIEVIYNMGSKEVVLNSDGWTIKTKDESTAGLFERTVAITKEGTLILT